MKLDNIEAILFDSGRVLNRPSTGHWFISPNFFSFVNQSLFDEISIEKRNLAFLNAGRYINIVMVIKTVDEEYEHFKKFFEIFSKELPELQLNEERIDQLAKDLVYNPDKYVFFDDAFRVIPILNKKYKLAIVSDAWPSLINVYANAGLLSYFSSFIISSIIGVSKPNEKMYSRALEELNVAANKAIFIDDNLRNCLGAKKLGIHAVLLCRDRKYFALQKILGIARGYKVIQSLNELL